MCELVFFLLIVVLESKQGCKFDFFKFFLDNFRIDDIIVVIDQVSSYVCKGSEFNGVIVDVFEDMVNVVDIVNVN